MSTTNDVTAVDAIHRRASEFRDAAILLDEQLGEHYDRLMNSGRTVDAALARSAQSALQAAFDAVCEFQVDALGHDFFTEPD